MNEKFNLALEEFIHVAAVLVLIIAFVSVLTGIIRAFIPQEKLQKKFAKTGRFSGLMGAILGIPTPFCSASMVPVSMGMIKMGAPFAMVFSFLLSAPLANFVVVGFIFGVFGWKVALVYFLIVFMGSVLIGSIVGKTSLRNEVKLINTNSKKAQTPCTAQPQTNSCNTATQFTEPCKNRQQTEEKMKPMKASVITCHISSATNTKLNDALTFGWSLFKRIFPYVLIGALISAVSTIFVTDVWVQKYLGNDSPLAIPIAAIIGVPLYLRIEMAIPILSALILKGMNMGAAMSLIIGGTGASLPEIAIISSMLKPKAIIAFILSVMVMAITGGYIFYIFF